MKNIRGIVFGLTVAVISQPAAAIVDFKTASSIGAKAVLFAGAGIGIPFAGALGFKKTLGIRESSSDLASGAATFVMDNSDLLLGNHLRPSFFDKKLFSHAFTGFDTFKNLRKNFDWKTFSKQKIASAVFGLISLARGFAGAFAGSGLNNKFGCVDISSAIGLCVVNKTNKLFQELFTHNKGKKTDKKEEDRVESEGLFAWGIQKFTDHEVIDDPKNALTQQYVLYDAPFNNALASIGHIGGSLYFAWLKAMQPKAAPSMFARLLGVLAR